MWVEFLPQGESFPLLMTLDPQLHRQDSIWRISLPDVRTNVRYRWRLDREDTLRPGDAFDPRIPVLDPRAPLVVGAEKWRQAADRWSFWPGSEEFDWQGVSSPCIQPQERIIYEVHLRGWTRDDSSGVRHPGTYEGMVEKIPWLVDLGVTTVEFLPLFEFDELENPRINPLTGEALVNYWGYSPLSLFAPKASYASSDHPGAAARAFKTLVRELHRAGIEVVLDVVYNHSGSSRGAPKDPQFTFRHLDNRTYYLLDEVGDYRNLTGCGNTLRTGHPVVQDLIIDSLRHWVETYQVDGFRFDLASIMSRDKEGRVVDNPALLQRIESDPLLKNKLLIAEPWDAGFAYRGGWFAERGLWLEWNDHYRDRVRRSLRGDLLSQGDLASSLTGSSPRFEATGKPTASVNYLTCHDGPTLHDLVSFESKKNWENGEDNLDGRTEFFGATWREQASVLGESLRDLRLRIKKNALALLMLSRGTPMILAGDELGRTQGGNNNTWCQDNSLSWMDWTPTEGAREMHRWTRQLIRLRREHPLFARNEFYGPQDIRWMDLQGKPQTWDREDPSLRVEFVNPDNPGQDYLLFYNPSMESRVVPLAGEYRALLNTVVSEPNGLTKPLGIGPYQLILFMALTL